MKFNNSIKRSFYGTGLVCLFFNIFDIKLNFTDMSIPELVDHYEDVFADLTIIGSAARLFESEYRTFRDILKITTLEKFGDSIPGYFRSKDLVEVKSFIYEYLDTGGPDFLLEELEKKQQSWFEDYTKAYYP